MALYEDVTKKKNPPAKKKLKLHLVFYAVQNYLDLSVFCKQKVLIYALAP